MNSKVNKLLMNYATNDFTIINDICNKLKNENSKIIEVVGKRGSGKSFIFKKIISSIEEEEKSCRIFLPISYKQNHFKEIVQLLTDMEDRVFNTLIKDAQKFNFSNRFDFFYYFSQQLIKKELLSPVNILIYEEHFLDEYTSDFIHYIVQQNPKNKLHFIIFSRQETFTFSEKLKIKTPYSDNLKEIVNALFPKSKSTFLAESEMLHKSTDGNLFLLEYILSEVTKKSNKLGVSDFVDKQITTKKIITDMIDKLTASEKKLLLTLFLLGNHPTLDKLKKINKTKGLANNLKKLVKKQLIFQVDDKYYVNKISEIRSYFLDLSKSKRDKYIKETLKHLEPELSDDFKLMYNKDDSASYTPVINYLTEISDYQSLVQIYKNYLDIIKDEDARIDILTKLGLRHKNLGKLDLAAEKLRKALKLCIKRSKPADDIILNLARSLHQMGSSAFALEVIKKYSFSSNNHYLKCKILLLNAEINLETENFEDSSKTLKKVSQLSEKINDKKLQNSINAEVKKLKGKIYYYLDEWTKATSEFEDSKQLYKKSKDAKGLAAIYNNLGVLAMFRGQNKPAEKLFLKSLDYEKKSYNLKGISVCYSNLGGFYEEHNDYEKSIKSLDAALQIQKLLADKYSITNIYLNIGVTYMDNGEYKKSEEALIKSLEMAIQFKFYKNIIASYNNLGALYFKWGDFSKAIEYYEKAVKKSKDNEFFEGMCQSYNNLGELYEKRGEYNLAYEFYTKGIELIDKISEEFMKSELKGNMGSVLTRLHKFREAYGYLVESYDFFKKLGAKDKIIEGSHKQAVYFILTRNYESANYYLDTAMKLSEEIENIYLVGKTYYWKAFLEEKNTEVSLDFLKKAIERFVKTNHNLDLALANYEYANLLLKKDEWEQAYQILINNKKIIQKFDAINILEKNDVLIQKINKKYATELKESKNQETILNKFYDITQNLNNITDFDLLLNTALDKLVDFAEADEGILALYHNPKVKDSWEYLILNNINSTDKIFPKIMSFLKSTYDKSKAQNDKQPHYAPEYNNIICFPLTVRNEQKGVICLLSKLGSHYFTEKMFNFVSALCNQITVIVENISYENLQKSHKLIREKLETSQSYSNIIGNSKKLQEIFHMIDKIKNSSTTVLLEGPSGTGKELIAKAIHYNSNRKNGKFIAQYCGALPKTLLESELFGHVKGSFTGATRDKKGLFEEADGGTFFLDEIADISISTQAKLLRFLQEGEIKPVGSTKTLKVDVRVICATNVSLKEKVDEGEFRLDLYYRLNVIQLNVPPLKERKSDIPLLAIHFLDKYSKKMGKDIKGLTDEAMKQLKNYDWPGNIRQLENEIERAVTLSNDDDSIKSSDLSDEVLQFKDNVETIQILEPDSLKSAVEELEKNMIVDELKQNDYNQTHTAKKLGLSRQGLIKKMKRYKIAKKSK